MLTAFLRQTRDRFSASTATWLVTMLAYIAVVLVLLAPVLLSSIGGDDRNWVLERGPLNDGSVWRAFWTPLTHAFDFEYNPRGTALAVSDRSVLALLTMKIAIMFSIPPMIVWALLKLSLFALSIVAVRVFLRQVTFRDAGGDIRPLTRRSIAFITIALPVMIAIGIKSQDLATFNGWNHYPPLTWGTFIGYFFFAALVLKLSTLLQRNLRAWAVPVVILMVFFGIVINLSYEMVALVLPISLLVLLLQPALSGETRWQRWRPKVLVLAPLVVSYLALFAWIRHLMNQRACLETDTCYPGLVVEINPRTLFYNFVGAMPGNNADAVTQQANSIDRPFPEAGAASIALAVLAVLLMWGLWIFWNARERAAARDQEPAPDSDVDDSRGLLGVLLLALCIAVGSAAITGITERAVDTITTPLVAYRSSVVTWSALALAAVVLIRLLMRARIRPLTWASVAVLTTVIAVAIAVYFPRNVMSAQANRASESVQFTDTLQLELALGDTSKTADERRCRAITDEVEQRRSGLTTAVARTVNSAYRAFEFYHGQPYCSTGIGRAGSS